MFVDFNGQLDEVVSYRSLLDLELVESTTVKVGDTENILTLSPAVVNEINRNYGMISGGFSQNLMNDRQCWSDWYDRHHDERDEYRASHQAIIFGDVIVAVVSDDNHYLLKFIETINNLAKVYTVKVRSESNKFQFLVLHPEDKVGVLLDLMISNQRLTVYPVDATGRVIPETQFYFSPAPISSKALGDDIEMVLDMESLVETVKSGIDPELILGVYLTQMTYAELYQSLSRDFGLKISSEVPDLDQVSEVVELSNEDLSKLGHIIETIYSTENAKHLYGSWLKKSIEYSPYRFIDYIPMIYLAFFTGNLRIDDLVKFTSTIEKFKTNHDQLV